MVHWLFGHVKHFALETLDEVARKTDWWNNWGRKLTSQISADTLSRLVERIQNLVLVWFRTVINDACPAFGLLLLGFNGCYQNISLRIPLYYDFYKRLSIFRHLSFTKNRKILISRKSTKVYIENFSSV